MAEPETEMDLLDERKRSLERIADRYRAAYVARDPSLAPFASRVRYSENNVAMAFPDGTWDTVDQEVGPALTIVDALESAVGIYTAISMLDVKGFLAVRLKIENGEITEIEHLFSSPRNLSGPPTPIGDPSSFTHDPDMLRILEPSERATRAQLIAHANGYFATLEHNTGELRGTDFSDDCVRYENGKAFPDVKRLFELGRYRFNERVRDRAFLVVDEDKGLVMARGFIDHKGQLDTYELTDGTPQQSIFREPHTWSLLETFKVADDEIVGVEAVFIAVPYNMASPWAPRDWQN